MSVLSTPNATSRHGKTAKFFAISLAAVQIVSGFAAAQTYDSSGRDGSNGSRPSSYGADASRSTSGENAGDINLSLREAGSGGPGILQVVGTVGGRSVQDQITLSPRISLHMIARGGRGGNGGHGADGSPGYDGSRGSDATRYSSGTSGGNGGPGGDGGDGTPGSDGGRGGKIVVQLPADDIHLALLVDHDVQGGQGGERGSNGSGGRGGYGGAGGSSYSWQEKTGESCTTSYRSNGNGSSTAERNCTPTYSYRSNSGGSSGMNGSRGSDGHGNTSGGSKGADGDFGFEVHGPSGIARYRRAFDLRLKSYKLNESDSNGVFEPGETVEVSDIVVENQSEMPWLPGKARAILSLQSVDWIVAQPIEIDVPAVSGHQAITLPQSFRFKIRGNTLSAAEDRLSISQSIVPRSRMTRLERSIVGLELPKTFVISYPVEISRLQTKRSAVKPGETVDVFWSVKNMSTKPLGLQSADARAIATSLKMWRPKGNETMPGGITFDGGQSGGSPTSTFAQSIALLAPQASFVIKGRLTFDESHLPYTDINIATNMTLKTLESEDAREVQLRTFRFSIAQTFNGSPDAQWLIVTNGGTKRDEYLAWLKLAGLLKKKVDVWDLSYQGYMNLTQALSQGSTLANIYAGKTIIVLNNSFTKSDADGPKEINSRFLMSQKEIIDSLAQKGTRFYFVGGTPSNAEPSLIDGLLTPRFRMNSVQRLSFDDAIDLFKSQKALALNSVLDIDIQEKFVRAPDRSTFKKRVEQLRKVLQKSYPEQRFAVLEWPGDVEKRNDDFFALYHLGRVTVTSSLNRGSTGDVTWLPRAGDEMKTSEFILGSENLQGLMLASSIRDKYFLLKTASASGSTISAWKDVLLNGLVLELAETLDIPTPNLKPLNELTALIQAESDTAFRTQVLSTLWARLYFYADDAADFKMSKSIKPLEKAMSRGVKVDLFDDLVEKEIDRLDDEASARKKVLVGIDKKKNIRRMLFLPLVSRSLRSSHSLTHDLM